MHRRASAAVIRAITTKSTARAVFCWRSLSDARLEEIRTGLAAIAPAIPLRNAPQVRVLTKPDAYYNELLVRAPRIRALWVTSTQDGISRARRRIIAASLYVLRPVLRAAASSLLQVSRYGRARGKVDRRVG